MKRAYIKDIACYVPEKILDNKYFESSQICFMGNSNDIRSDFNGCFINKRSN